MIPARRPGQSFESHQQEMAGWTGCGSIDELNRLHDPLHRSLCAWLGIDSQALRQSAGDELTHGQQLLAILEEEAVLHVQRLICHAGIEVPA